MFCQICKIPFDIARIRTIDEHPDDAWGSYGQDFVYFSDLDGCEDCSVLEDEHIAGLNCQCRRGYSGHRITASEMRDIKLIQCLHVKDNLWSPEPRDEDFDVEAELCFSTGVGEEGSTDDYVERLEPVKHGIAETLVDNNTIEPIRGNQQLQILPLKRMRRFQGELLWAIPLHPWCFEVFKRQSLQRLEKVDIDRIWEWRNRIGSYVEEGSIERVVLGDWYNCEGGTEYFVANPIEIPGLQELFFSCILPSDELKELVFPTRTDRVCEKTADLFAKLPREVCFMIVEELSKKDIAHLRLVSRSYSQLPQSYFHRLVLSEMPWVWEVEALARMWTDWHGLWCKLLRAEGGPLDRYREYERNEDAIGRLAEIGTCDVIAKTFTPRNDGVLKGLRNRRRIYAHIEEILKAP